MKKIVLYGELGRKFGKYWYLDVNSPAEAVRAIGVNRPDFVEYLMKAEENSVRFKVFAGKENPGPEQLTNPLSDKEVIRIVPVIAGAGGMGMIIVGAILIVIGFFTYGATTKLGIMLVVAGIATLIVQHYNKPKTREESEDPDNRPSFSFGGAVNTVMQGGCVPVCYGGPIEVGSYVVSGSIDSRDIPI